MLKIARQSGSEALPVSGQVTSQWCQGPPSREQQQHRIDPRWPSSSGCKSAAVANEVAQNVLNDTGST